MNSIIMNYILLDTNKDYENLLPLTYTRPVSEIRVGILTIREKWQHFFKNEFSYITKDYLSQKYPKFIHRENLLINSSILPDKNLIEQLSLLEPNSYLMHENTFIGVNLFEYSATNITKINFLKLEKIEYSEKIDKISFLWDIFSLNGSEIEKDYKLITKGRKSAPISKTNTLINSQNIFVETSATVECSVLNPGEGYIYIGKEAVVMENSVIKGSFALCEKAQLKVGTTSYGPTTIGPHSKFGGELNNIVVLGHTNKAHSGFLGNSVIGEWCNLGAATNNSNLKNNYKEVKLWNYNKQKFIETGLQFCGLIMADHSKCGINTMFNTGTVVGVSANIYGANFPRNFIPSFSWGGAAGFVEYELSKAIKTAQRAMKRRNKELSANENSILSYIFKNSEKFRIK